MITGNKNIPKIGACPVLESDTFPFGIYLETIVETDHRVSHSHDYINLIYIVNGAGEHVYNGSHFQVSKGDVFIIEPNKDHYYTANAGHTLEVYGVQFQPELLRNELEVLIKVNPFFDFFYVEPFFRETVDFSLKLTLNPAEQIEFRLLLDLLGDEFNQKRLGYRLMIQTKLLGLFVYLSRCYDKLDNATLLSGLDDCTIIERVCEFIQKYYAQAMTLQQISRLCGMSQSTFTYHFKEVTGMSFLQFRNRVRCDAAKSLLTSSNLKIIAIANEVGFEDVSNFNKTFKRMEGISPREYRKQMTVNGTLYEAPKPR
ncbi:helix-turn-helix domain-containing protein [Paenibacillus agri]|uniref:Helix-turn-helix transcriptional regulator n=1 Tax=Paenibacillus agri TaxID=2744309 RepID=A0A850EN80_9BACL|nr:AraC family transcriptional regulator [Paenibacillus agri]NUU61876.1 helix-turn-helix transcriptional regulator [Paenibacillus agri]